MFSHYFFLFLRLHWRSFYFLSCRIFLGVSHGNVPSKLPFRYFHLMQLIFPHLLLLMPWLSFLKLEKYLIEYFPPIEVNALFERHLSVRSFESVTFTVITKFMFPISTFTSSFNHSNMCESFVVLSISHLQARRGLFIFNLTKNFHPQTNWWPLHVYLTKSILLPLQFCALDLGIVFMYENDPPKQGPAIWILCCEMIRLYDQGVCIGINDQLAPFQHQQHMKGRGKGGHVIITRRAFLHGVFSLEGHQGKRGNMLQDIRGQVVLNWVGLTDAQKTGKYNN